MKLIDYIRGDRRGREANIFEQEAMDDPFLSDAIEGYDSVYGDHLDMVKRLENWVDDRAVRRKQARRRTIVGICVAAAVVLVGGGIAFFNYAGYRPSEHTVAELLTEENPKRYISQPEFYGEIEPSGTLIAAANAAKEIPGEDLPTGDTLSAVSAAPDKPVMLAAHTTTAEAPAGQTAKDTPASVAAVPSSADVPPVPHAKETAAAPSKEILAAETDAHAEKTAVTSPEKTLLADGAAGSGERNAHIATTRAEVVPDGPIDTVYNASFTDYFLENRRPKTDPQGNPQSGLITIEFNVNAAGVPSTIRVLSSFSREANREVIEMLVEGPRWEPTQDRRIRTIVEY